MYLNICGINVLLKLMIMELLFLSLKLLKISYEIGNKEVRYMAGLAIIYSLDNPRMNIRRMDISSNLFQYFDE